MPKKPKKAVTRPNPRVRRSGVPLPDGIKQGYRNPRVTRRDIVQLEPVEPPKE